MTNKITIDKKELDDLRKAWDEHKIIFNTLVKFKDLMVANNKEMNECLKNIQKILNNYKDNFGCRLVQKEIDRYVGGGK